MRTRTGILASALVVLPLAACGTAATATARTTAAPDSASSAVASARAVLAAASASCSNNGGTWNGVSCSTPAAAPTVTTLPATTPTKVEFVVSGTAPGGINITYGPAGSNFSGPQTLDGNATMSVPFDGQAEYYALNAQLQGGGSIKCKIVVTGPGDNPLTVSSGAASGGFNICDAQAAPTDSTGLSWDNEQ